MDTDKALDAFLSNIQAESNDTNEDSGVDASIVEDVSSKPVYGEGEDGSLVHVYSVQKEKKAQLIKDDNGIPTTAHPMERKYREEESKVETAGKAWHNMQSSELTEQVKLDFKVLQMRGYIDPKRFYKKESRKKLPKFFQVGTILPDPLAPKHMQMTKKERNQSMLNSVMNDDKAKRYLKRTFLDIQASHPVATKHKSHKKKKR